MSQNGNSPTTCRLVVVGDVHDAWSDRDVASLLHLQPTMVLFVGDFGNEAVQLVAEVARLALPKAVILGNHDAWYTMTGPKPRKKPWNWGISEHLHGLGALAKQAAAAAPPSSDGQRHTGAAAPPAASSPAAPAADADAAAAAQPAGSSGQQQLPGSCQVPAPTATAHPGPQLSRSSFEGVDAQLQLLGPAHVGFSSMPVPGHNLAVLGARPFSKGGSVEGIAPFYDCLYGMSTSEQYTERIVREGRQAAADPGPAPVADGAAGAASGQEAGQQGSGSGSGGAAGRGRSVVLLAHNGPSGMGSKAYSPCGIDWREGEGDHGDTDLRAAIEQLREAGVKLPLVLFGHMHHVLSGGRGRRQMVHVEPSGTVYLNAATVPRVRRPLTNTNAGSPAPAAAAAAGRKAGKQHKRDRERAKALPPHLQAVPVPVPSRAPTQHHFLVVELEGEEVALARDVWVEVQPPPPAGPPSQEGEGEGAAAGALSTVVVQEQELFRRLVGGPAWCSYHDAARGLKLQALRAEPAAAP